MNPRSGDIFLVQFPFVRCMASKFDGEGTEEFVSWRPGVVGRYVGYEGDSELIAHGVGSARIEVVSVHKPGPKYPERVFFVRTWVTPEEHVFGKTALRIKSIHSFRKLVSGYAHEYRLDNPIEGEITWK